MLLVQIFLAVEQLHTPYKIGGNHEALDMGQIDFSLFHPSRVFQKLEKSALKKYSKNNFQKQGKYTG